MSVRNLYDGPIFRLIQKDMMINGVMTDRDIIIHTGGVAVLCYEEGKVLLVRQTRAAANAKTLEIPAGMVEPHENPADCGRRELNEETGMSCSEMKLITAFWPTPGYDTEVIWIYRCLDVKKAEHHLAMDADEDTVPFWMDLDEAWNKVCTGEIRDGKTIIGIQHLMLERAGLLKDAPAFDEALVDRNLQY